MWGVKRRLFDAKLLAVLLAGCSSAPIVPPDAQLIARHVNVESGVTIPPGARHVYVVQSGPQGFVSNMALPPTTQPMTLPVAPLAIGADPTETVDVFVSDH
jgi:hypothetical protein